MRSFRGGRRPPTPTRPRGRVSPDETPHSRCFSCFYRVPGLRCREESGRAGAGIPNSCPRSQPAESTRFKAPSGPTIGILTQRIPARPDALRGPPVIPGTTVHKRARFLTFAAAKSHDPGPAGRHPTRVDTGQKRFARNKPRGRHPTRVDTGQKRFARNKPRDPQSKPILTMQVVDSRHTVSHEAGPFEKNRSSYDRVKSPPHTKSVSSGTRQNVRIEKQPGDVWKHGPRFDDPVEYDYD
jgi:hypothetical protein